MLCYSTGSLPPFKDFQQLVDLLKDSPFSGIELVITPEFLTQWKDKDYWTKSLRTLLENGFCIRNIHMGFPTLLSSTPHSPGIGAKQSEQREQKLEAIKKSIEIAFFLEAPHFTVTTGMLDNLTPLHLQEKWVYDSMEIIVEMADHRLIVGIEQEPEHIIHSTEQLLTLCKKFKGKVKANFDIGHSQVLKENIEESLQSLFPYLYNLHFEDIKKNIHQHLLFGEGEIDFLPLFTLLKKLNYKGDMTPDLYPFTDQHVKALKASATFFKHHSLPPL